MVILESLRRKFRPLLEETLADEGAIIVDAEVNNRRLSYAHNLINEQGILTAYVYGNRDTIQAEFFDRHIPNTSLQNKGKTGWTRALEEVVYYHDDNTTERFVSPMGGTLEYTDRQGNTFRATAHDPVVSAIMAQAKERYQWMQQWYGRELLPDVQREARKKVSG